MGAYSGRRREASKPASSIATFGLVGALSVAVVLSCVLLGGRQFVLLQYYDELQGMNAELAFLRVEVEELKWKQETFQSDPFGAEMFARERMNYSVPGEVIFRFETPD